MPVQMFILCTSVQNMSRTLLCGTIVALTFFLVFCVVSAEHVPLSFVRLRIIKCGVFEERHYSFVVCVVAYKFYNEMCLGVFAEYVPLSFVQLPIIKLVFTEHIPSSSVQLPIM